MNKFKILIISNMAWVQDYKWFLQGLEPPLSQDLNHIYTKVVSIRHSL